jgi:ribonuclease BN (tRNA processing enzyme)
VAYCTDTEFDPQTIRRTAGVTTLLHEACEPVDAERGHTSGDEAGVIAAEAGVSRLLLTHSHPLPGVPERTAVAAQARFAATVSATDGAVLEL